MKTVNLFAVSSLFAITVVVVLHAQPPIIEWTRTYGGAYWDQTHSVVQTSDGGYILAGETKPSGSGLFDVYLVKTDYMGNMLWSRTYGSAEEEDAAYSILQTSDGGYIIAGYTGSFGADFHDMMLIKTDGQGDTIWVRTYGGTGFEWAHDMQQTSDGGYILAGYSSSSGGSPQFGLVKTDSLGNECWFRSYGPSYSYAYSVDQTNDGGYVLAGVDHGDIYVLKTDSVGDYMWTHTYGGDSCEWAWSIQQTTEGGYIIAGFTNDSFAFDEEDMYVIKTDSIGDTLWTRSYGGFYGDYVKDVGQTADGNYLLVGRSYQNPDVLKIDSIGNILWGIETDGWLSSFDQTLDGWYIAAGHIYPQGQFYTDSWLVKIGPDTFIYHPEIQVSDSLLNFEEVMVLEDSSLGLVVYNMGNANLVIHDVTTSDSSFFTYFDPSDSLIAPGDSLEILVTFAPQDTLQYTETLSIENNDELMEIVLLGIGLPPNAVALEPPSKMPTTFALKSVYPNPFNAQATIRYDVPVHGEIRIDVYDVLGREVANLVDGVMPVGAHSVIWDAGDLPSGIYFCRMNSADFNQIRKILLLK